MFLRKITECISAVRDESVANLVRRVFGNGRPAAARAWPHLVDPGYLPLPNTTILRINITRQELGQIRLTRKREEGKKKVTCLEGGPARGSRVESIDQARLETSTTCRLKAYLSRPAVILILQGVHNTQSA